MSLAIFLGVWALFDRQRLVSTRTKIGVFLLTSVATLFALSFSGQETISKRLYDVPGLGAVSMTDYEAGSGRLGLWRHHWRAFTGGTPVEILLGQGLGSSMVVSQALYSAMGLPGEVQGPHNEYLWLLVETGIAGFALYFGFLLSLVAYCLRVVRAPAGEYSAEVTAFVVVFFAYFVSYQLAKEFFGWGITEMGVRWYFLLFLGLVSVAPGTDVPYLAPSDAKGK